MDETRMADQVAEILGMDGQHFYAPDGTELSEICAKLGAEKQYADLTHAGNILPRDFSSITTDTRTRYLFTDGSALVVSGDAWDFEGPEPFSWED